MNGTIIRLLTAFMRDGEKLYIVQEILEGGEVWETVKSYGCLYYPRAVSILAQIIMALKKLHRNNWNEFLII